MSHSFRWLHFTDLHWGSDAHKYEWAAVKKQLLPDLEKLQSNVCGGPFDAVFFTGDLVDKGKPKQFEAFNQTLSQIWSVLKTEEHDPWFVAVPGNHDLTRPKGNPDGLLLLREFHKNRDVREKVWSGKAGAVKNTLRNAFRNYSNWWKDLPTTFRKPETSKAGLLPGEFAATLQKGPLSIGVLGLNTAFLQLEGGDYEKKLAMDARQFSKACGEDYSAWIEQHQICFLLTHHPSSWLSRACHDEAYEGFIYQPDHFLAHLSGHVHQSAVNEFTKGGPKATRREITALSLFGREEAEVLREGKTTKYIDRALGYSAGVFTLEGDKGYVRIWPRRVVKKAGNVWILERDFEQILEGDGGTEKREVHIRSLAKSKKKVSESPNVPKNPAKPATDFQKLVKSSLKELFKKRHFEPFKKELSKVFRKNDPLVYLLEGMDLLSSMRIFTETIQNVQERTVLSAKCLLDCEIFMGWLSLLAVREDWQPPVDLSADSGTQEIDLFIPVSHEASLEIVMSRLSYSPARFVDKPSGILSIRGSGYCPMPDLIEVGPDVTEMVNAIKASLWLTLMPEDENQIYEKKPGGEKCLRPWTQKKNAYLVAKLKYHHASPRLVTPYFLVNREADTAKRVPGEVIRILRTELAPLKIISFGEGGDLWDGTIQEEDLMVHLEGFYKLIAEAKAELRD